MENTFIIKAKATHGCRYDYSLVDYKDSKTKVVIICPIHGEFSQRPDHHISTGGCKQCGVDTRKSKRCLGLDAFIINSNKVHNSYYDYSLVKYVNNNIKIKIICPKHGIFEQQPKSHLKGHGCNLCAVLVNSDNLRYDTEEFIRLAKQVHDNRYDYTNVKYSGAHEKVTIRCNIHGDFEQKPNDHLNNSTGCPVCKESKGEKFIREYLIKNQIKHMCQHKFDSCRDIRILPFDFYLPEYNLCIEYDGIQHFKPVENFGGLDGFESTKRRDIIKNKFCVDNHINLLRIAYYSDVTNELNKVLT
jgi:very-short-patch-repair endonuclease